MSNLIRNERAKLSATYLNGVAVALLAVGGLAPLTSLLVTGMPVGAAGQLTWLFLGCMVISVAPHFSARLVLKGMRE